MSYLWIVGAGVAILGSVCSNLGVNIQKYSFMKNSKKDQSEQKSYYRQPLWVLGFFLVFVGSLGDFSALGLAAQSIVAPIGSTTLVANIMFAHYWLEEHLSKRDLLGTCLIILGSVLAVLFGDHTAVTYTLSDLKSFYLRTVFLCYVFFMIFATALFYSVVRKIEPLKNKLVDAEKRFEEAQKNDDYDAALKEDTLITILSNAYKPYEKMHPFCYCAVSGTFGGQSILFGKMVAELIGSSIRGDNQMIYGLTYVFVIVMLCTVFTQIHFLAKALSFFDALYVVPVFQCFFISVSTIAGACYFLEFDRFTTSSWIVFPIGILMTLSGVYVLSAREMTKERPRLNKKVKKKKKRRMRRPVELTPIQSLPPPGPPSDAVDGTDNAHQSAGSSTGAGGADGGDGSTIAAAAADAAAAASAGATGVGGGSTAGGAAAAAAAGAGGGGGGGGGGDMNSPTTPVSPDSSSPVDNMVRSDQDFFEEDEDDADDDEVTPKDGGMLSPGGVRRRRHAGAKTRTPHPLRRTSTGSSAVMLSHMYSQRNILNVNPKMALTPRGPTTPASIRQSLSVPPSASTAASAAGPGGSPAASPVLGGLSAPATPSKDSGAAAAGTPGGGGPGANVRPGATTPTSGPARTLSTFLSSLVKDVRDMTQDQWQKMSEGQKAGDSKGGDGDDPFQEEFYHGPVDEDGNPIVTDSGNPSPAVSPTGSQGLRIKIDGPDAEEKSRQSPVNATAARGYVDTRLEDQSRTTLFTRFASWFEKKDEREGRVLFFT